MSTCPPVRWPYLRGTFWNTGLPLWWIKSRLLLWSVPFWFHLCSRLDHWIWTLATDELAFLSYWRLRHWRWVWRLWLLRNYLNLDQLNSIIEWLLPKVWSPPQTILMAILAILSKYNTLLWRLERYWGLNSPPLLFWSVVALTPAFATLSESQMGTGRPCWTTAAATLIEIHLIPCTSSRRS